MHRLLLGTFLTLSAFAQSQNYFPLQVGNQWVYRVGGAASGGTHVVEINSARTVNGHEYFVTTGLPGSPLLLRINEAGSLVFYKEADNQEHNWVVFGAATGEVFRSEIDSCNPTAVIRSKSAKLESPIGNFDNALEVGYAPGNCADAGLIRESFLPNIGLAQRRQSNFAGEQVWDLIYARVGSTTIGGGSTTVGGKEHSFGGALDASQYRPGGLITVRMTLRNTQEQPVQLTFPSGQDYDVVIKNEAGESVYTWSAGRAFPAVFRTIDISGERNWALTIPAPSTGGNYTATLTLAVAKPAVYETIVPFTVQ